MDGSEVRRKPFHTPLRGGGATPLKTPLRTHMEQTSSTPITPFEAIEKQKENVQPRQRGRSAHALSTAFGMEHKQRQELLHEQREEHERAVSDAVNADADDPLEAWCAYVKWCVDNYPSGKSTESGIVPLLERATRAFKDSEQYAQDSRYLRVWILYAQNTDVPTDVFQYLLSHEIGTRLAALYEELALVWESQHVYDEADATYQLGIARRAMPLDRIKRRYAGYQQRLLSLPESSAEGAQTYAKALAAAMARAGRSVLGQTTARGESKPANVLGRHQPLSRAAPSNARTMQVYRDENGDDAPAPGAAAWTDLAPETHRRKENDAGRRTLAPLESMTPRTQARALEVFCDSDEDHSPEKRTPRRDDIFHRAKMSETDRLRKSPFLYYEDAAPAASAAPAPAAPASASAPTAPAPASGRTGSAPAARTSAPGKPKARAAARPERHVAPLRRLYPGADIDASLAEKHRPIKASNELCLEELQALAADPDALSPTDPYAHLCASQGRWLPEREKRVPSPTLFTKAAILEVDNMFNGSDEESESDVSSSEAESDQEPYARMDENYGMTTPRHAARSPPPARLDRAPFGAPRPPFAPAAEPAELVGGREPFQPLTPITERTEVSRWTAASDASVDPAASNTSVDPAQGGAAPLGADAAVLSLPNPCSPADPDVVAAVLAHLATPLTSSLGYLAVPGATAHLAALQQAAGAHSRRSLSAASPLYTLHAGPHALGVLQKIGEGGYGAVFLARDEQGTVPMPGEEVARYDDIHDDDDDERERREAVAVKIERPANRWEFYVLAQLRQRLVPDVLSSIVGVRQFVVSDTESMLLLEYGAEGTLLELVNHAHDAGVAPVSAGTSGGGVEEVLAMFFMIELLRTIEAMHRAGVLHGDLKIDNCLVRSTPDAAGAWPSTYEPEHPAWRSHGVALIDFGRAVDLHCFPAGQTFVADWAPGPQDCVEMREMRPWTYETDYYGLASIAYCLLFGKYMDTTAHLAADGHKTYRIQQPLRRYWQTELWTRLFTLLLNPRDAGAWPLHDELATLRAEMETWLGANSFRAGKNLKGLLKKMEIWALQR